MFKIWNLLICNCTFGHLFPRVCKVERQKKKNQILGNVSTMKPSYYDLYFIYKHFVSSFIPHALSSVDLQFGTKTLIGFTVCDSFACTHYNAALLTKLSAALDITLLQFFLFCSLLRASFLIKCYLTPFRIRWFFVQLHFVKYIFQNFKLALISWAIPLGNVLIALLI